MYNTEKQLAKQSLKSGLPHGPRDRSQTHVHVAKLQHLNFKNLDQATQSWTNTKITPNESKLCIHLRYFF